MASELTKVLVQFAYYPSSIYIYIPTFNCNCGSKNNHGFITEPGQFYHSTVYVMDTFGLWQKEEVAIDVFPYNGQQCFRLNHFGTLDKLPEKKVFLCLNVELFKLSYIQIGATQPFENVKMWYTNEEEDPEFEWAVVLKSGRYHSKPYIVRTEHIHSITNTHHYGFSYWTTKVTYSHFTHPKHNKANWKFLKPCDLFQSGSVAISTMIELSSFNFDVYSSISPLPVNYKYFKVQSHVFGGFQGDLLTCFLVEKPNCSHDPECWEEKDRLPVFMTSDVYDIYCQEEGNSTIPVRVKIRASLDLVTAKNGPKTTYYRFALSKLLPNKKYTLWLPFSETEDDPEFCVPVANEVLPCLQGLVLKQEQTQDPEQALTDEECFYVKVKQEYYTINPSGVVPVNMGRSLPLKMVLSRQRNPLQQIQLQLVEETGGKKVYKPSSVSEIDASLSWEVFVPIPTYKTYYVWRNVREFFSSVKLWVPENKISDFVWPKSIAVFENGGFCSNTLVYPKKSVFDNTNHFSSDFALSHYNAIPQPSDFVASKPVYQFVFLDDLKHFHDFSSYFYSKNPSNILLGAELKPSSSVLLRQSPQIWHPSDLDPKAETLFITTLTHQIGEYLRTLCPNLQNPNKYAIHSVEEALKPGTSALTHMIFVMYLQLPFEAMQHVYDVLSDNERHNLTQKGTPGLRTSKHLNLDRINPRNITSDDPPSDIFLLYIGETTQKFAGRYSKFDKASCFSTYLKHLWPKSSDEVKKQMQVIFFPYPMLEPKEGLDELILKQLSLYEALDKHFKYWAWLNINGVRFHPQSKSMSKPTPLELYSQQQHDQIDQPKPRTDATPEDEGVSNVPMPIQPSLHFFSVQDQGLRPSPSDPEPTQQQKQQNDITGSNEPEEDSLSPE